jgi:glycosyltransferase involved in cell wall biosynthesis
LKGPLRVVFAGDGPERQRWEMQAATIANGSSDVQVKFVGWCTESVLGDIMGQTRLLVVPSVWPEPFGSVGMAAARHGVPAAAFAVGGIPQWLHEGVNGHLAPGTPPTAAGLADAIVRCLGEQRHYGELCAGARRIAASFTMEAHLPELVRVFERVVNGSH